jgi:hypothetical protein
MLMFVPMKTRSSKRSPPPTTERLTSGRKHTRPSSAAAAAAAAVVASSSSAKDGQAEQGRSLPRTFSIRHHGARKVGCSFFVFLTVWSTANSKRRADEDMPSGRSANSPSHEPWRWIFHGESSVFRPHWFSRTNGDRPGGHQGNTKHPATLGVLARKSPPLRSGHAVVAVAFEWLELESPKR